ncbi:hypothetical protein NDU88_003164 [Pleurodeles waltl]|uniref:Uncharacterized protein n=1 Tax=Pleurodeles waltl TaxID=8319 RepID=A0AAV7NJV7_PLEWA|nr:hypothetical protein NDU88_003164 [Pleurodeles waltl]
MASARPKKDRSMKDMLTKTMKGNTEGDTPTLTHREGDEDGENPITRSFLEGLFLSLKEDLQAVNRDLSRDLKEVRHELEAVGQRVANVEEHEHNKTRR